MAETTLAWNSEIEKVVGAWIAIALGTEPNQFESATDPGIRNIFRSSEWLR